MKKVLRGAGWLLLALVLAGGATLGWLFFHRPGLDAYAQHHYPAPDGAPPGTPGLYAAWFGTAAILISDGDHALFVDPFFSRPGGWLNLLRNRPIAPDGPRIAHALLDAGVRQLDAVLVSHSHYDHAMDAGVVARLSESDLAGSASTASIGRSALPRSEQLRVIAPGTPLRYGPFTVTFIESRHAGATGGRPTGEIGTLPSPARYLDYKQGGTYSILIEHPLGNVLHHGSAGFLPGALNGRRADVVFLGIALRGPLEPYLSAVVDAVGASRVIPVHWDDFTRPLAAPLQPAPFGVDLPGFFRQMADLRPGVRVLTLQLAQPVRLY